MLTVLLASLALAPTADFDRAFAGFRACFVLQEVGAKSRVVHNAPIAAERLSPCSTFKIPNSLIGLETGVARDTRHRYRWDGTRYPNRPAWERDQDMAAAIRNSTVWWYQRLAREIGGTRMRRHIDRMGYGNRNLSGGIDRFWLDSTLRISANEQVAMLARLERNALPFSRRSQEMVKGILLAERGDGWAYWGKTGSGRTPELGWYVGLVHAKNGRRYAFAANIRGKGAWGPRAKEIVRGLLAEMGLIGPRLRPAGVSEMRHNRLPL